VIDVSEELAVAIFTVCVAVLCSVAIPIIACFLLCGKQKTRVWRVAFRGIVDRRFWLQYIYHTHTHKRLIPSTSSFVNSGNCFLLSIYISKRSEGAVCAGQVVAPQFPRERPDQLWSPPGTRVVSTESKKPGFMLTTHFRLVTRLRMSGAIPPHLLYAFVACPGTNLPWTSLYSATFCAVQGTRNTTAALISAAVVFRAPTNCDQLRHFGQIECISASQ
jgi:hypothetical protein